jgi:very-short-patch-repair endonuclease
LVDAEQNIVQDASSAYTDDDYDIPVDIEATIGPSGAGLNTHQVYRRLVERPVHLKRNGVADRLLLEQQIGTVRFDKRKWRRRREDESFEDSVASQPQPDVTVRFLDAIPADVLPGSQPLTRSDEIDQGEAAPVGPPLLRKLLPYYRECLRLSGSSRISQYADRHKQQFELLQPRGRWWPDAAGSRVIRIERRFLSAEFIQGLHRRKHDPLLLGYPLSTTTAGEEVIFIDPVAILPCSWTVDDTALILWPTEVAPKLNPDWVKRRKERKGIKSIPLWLKGIADDADFSQSNEEAWADIPNFLRTLLSVTSTPSLSDIDPGKLRPRLDLSADGALQNIVGIFLVGEQPYSRRARADLRSLTAWSDDEFDQTALASILSAESHIESDPVPVVSPLALSESQYLAVRDGLTNPLTVISGPPGTGKSQVVVAIMVSAAAAGRSVLFASHRHQAIDAVQNRLEEIVGDQPILARAYAGDQDSSFKFEDAVNLILGRHTGKSAQEALAILNSAAAEICTELDNLVSSISDYEELGKDLAILTQESAHRSGFDMGETPKRKRSPFSWLFEALRRALRKFMPWQKAELKSVETVENLSLRRLEMGLEDTERKHRQIRKSPELATAMEQLPIALEELTRHGKALMPDLVNALYACNEYDTQQLVDLKGNLPLATDLEGLRKLWQDNAELVLRYFPLWACSTLAAPGRIPLTPGIFDYLVIDEAATSDIASALPLFARAKQAIIVGDRLQTAMISNLHPARDAELRRENGLSHKELGRFTYSQVSLFDLAWSASGAARHMLRDHFRCHSDIASYCSETFYGGRLFVRTEPSSLKAPKGQKPGLHWTNVTGPIERASKGCRSHAEATALVDHLDELIGNGDYKGTVGVVTPFAKQEELLVHMIEQRIPLDRIHQVDLRVGTSHKFQGDDRDVMLISLCYGADMPRNGAWFLQSSRELINVAVSRARAVCQIFGNRDAALSCDIKHIAQLARHIGSEGQPSGNPRDLFESPWEERLYDALKVAGLEPIPQYRLSGRRLDFALIKGKIHLDIEVDGDSYHRDPDGFRKASDVWRDYVVKSTGWKVRRFWVYELKQDMEKCVELVQTDLVN